MDKKRTIDELQQQSIEEAIRLLNSDVKKGLTQIKVEKYHHQYGYNEIPEKKSNPLINISAME